MNWCLILNWLIIIMIVILSLQNQSRSLGRCILFMLLEFDFSVLSFSFIFYFLYLKSWWISSLLETIQNLLRLQDSWSMSFTNYYRHLRFFGRFHFSSRWVKVLPVFFFLTSNHNLNALHKLIISSAKTLSLFGPQRHWLFNSKRSFSIWNLASS